MKAKVHKAKKHQQIALRKFGTSKRSARCQIGQTGCRNRGSEVEGGSEGSPLPKEVHRFSSHDLLKNEKNHSQKKNLSDLPHRKLSHLTVVEETESSRGHQLNRLVRRKHHRLSTAIFGMPLRWLQSAISDGSKALDSQLYPNNLVMQIPLTMREAAFRSLPLCVCVCMCI